MLITASSVPLRTALALATATILVGMAYSSCDSSSNACGSFRAPRHSAVHHRGCIRSDAFVLVDTGYRLVENVVIGDQVLTEDSSFMEVANVVCHVGKHFLWKMPGLPPATTPNHPVKLKGEWYAGDPQSALRDFGMHVTPMGVSSTTFVKTVCSIETVANLSVAIVVFVEGHTLFVAD